MIMKNNQRRANGQQGVALLFTLVTLVILSSLAVWSLATWITGHVDTMSGMLWSRGLMGASEAFYLPAARHQVQRLISLRPGCHRRK